ncbi:hypothetical protein [Saccharopolyspora mangrovi]|uniref:Uncharacterized protein n=1 Tax=Saccharopolyspora mangrovi TaxID=3082379 RepID=A0ABU6A8Y4_9PSEU|nr:hypothetical protein [Saccharopolyspora sp. S2-29]MEB3368032.1 hypothetical protein [Saccharopolyspora sp. S2-29]
MGEKQTTEAAESVPIYEELANELCDPADTTWQFSPVPSFVSELTEAAEGDEESAAVAS